MSNHIELSIDDKQQLASISKAIGSELRLQILELLFRKPYNIAELSEILDVPFSTVALNINVLESAGIILTEKQPSTKGSMSRICTPRVKSLNVALKPETKSNELTHEIFDIPIGLFSDCSISPTCGLLSESNIIGLYDDPTSFYHNERHDAQLIWFYQGFLEYRFRNMHAHLPNIKSISFSFEICSEAPFYNNEWPSDITMSVAGKEITTWTSPGDFGGRYGNFTPRWWGVANTQFGSLKTISINENQTLLDGIPVSDLNLSSLKLETLPYIAFKLEIKDDAKNIGGLNLFGTKFGDHPQPIRMQVSYIK